MLQQYGAPGSHLCDKPDDLQPISEQNLNIHPQLFAIAESKASGNVICALRSASSDNTPWPIVETRPKSRGMTLLSLNSEHLMRRMACQADSDNDAKELVELYNQGLGQGSLPKELDSPYEAGSVKQLGYGCDKYVLLRVGPFPDLYQSMALGHQSRKDESSSLIAAEASNNKFGGFGSSYLFYARLLEEYSRPEEARDAARLCLRLPLPTIGYRDEDFREIAVLAQLAGESDSTEEGLAKLQIFYEKVRAKEAEEDPSKSGKTDDQIALDEATYLLDRMTLQAGEIDWNTARRELADIYEEAGKPEMAFFVDPSRT
jgi:hypothetical protein